jgi:hypothetical protein
MRSSPHYSSHSSASLPFSTLQERYIDDELVAGERIGVPVRSSRGRRFLRAVFTTSLVLGSAYVVARDPATWWQRAQWVGEKAGSLLALMEAKGPVRAEVPSQATPPKLEPLAVEPPIRQAAVRAGVPVEAAPPAEPARAEPDAAAVPEVEPLPPPVVDPNDPYQRRAEAVGLHPGLSRVLLARLSAADYRNAEHAINTAIAKTADGSVFAWPRQRTPELALFKVHFVRGMTPECRRYVVTVTKDGWLTTALPMERCGPNLRQAMRK